VEALEERLQPSASTSLISSNFNGTAIPAGASIWFNSVAKVSGLGSSTVHLDVVHQSITFTANGTNYNLAVPDTDITFSPTATSATTSFDATTHTWVTNLPSNWGPGNLYLGGLSLPLPQGLPGGINPVNWQATFQADTPGLSVNWQWGAAVYTNFSTDYNFPSVKPVDSNQLSAYKNSDHAGTPEAFRSYVTGGARGGGGSNWTGSYSSTHQATPAFVMQTAPSSLSGVVYADNNGTGVFAPGDTGLSGVTVTLTGTDDLGNTVNLTTVTDNNGRYSFSGLRPGTYTIMEHTPSGFTDETASAGSQGGTAAPGQVFGINLAAGVHGIGYNFAEQAPVANT
jgi:hypothetical protein